MEDLIWVSQSVTPSPACLYKNVEGKNHKLQFAMTPYTHTHSL